MITKQQYHRLMNEHEAHGNITVSALKADTSRPTARKYVRAGKSSAELQAKHPWRTPEFPVTSWSRCGARHHRPSRNSPVLAEKRHKNPWINLWDNPVRFS